MRSVCDEPTLIRAEMWQDHQSDESGVKDYSL